MALRVARSCLGVSFSAVQPILLLSPRLLSLILIGRLKSICLALGRMLVMSADISLVLEVAVKPDVLDEFGALIREAVAEDEAAEPGSRILECFIDGHDAHSTSATRTQPLP